MKTALTIGFFDGVHLGHRSLLNELRKHPHATILTFSNHPQSLFSPPAPPQLISLEEKVKRLSPFADKVIVLPFTHEFASTPFDELLAQFNLSHLILGANSTFGKNREGNEENVKKFAEKNHFTVEYIPKLLFLGEPVSSSRIRNAMASGELTLANQLLGKI